MYETKTLSPKQLAEAIGVSESSIRRWVDDGLINVMRTAGGHRRILLREAVRFVRSQSLRVLRPELLGFPDLAHSPALDERPGRASELLFQLLLEGDEVRARGFIVRSFLTGTGLGELFDEVIAGALRRVGELWQHGAAGIYQEHRATQICLAAVHQIRTLTPVPAPGAPCALGGAPSGDPTQLPSLMAGTVAAFQGYRDITLGPETPGSALLAAVEEHRPQVVWLSLTAHLPTERVDAVLHEAVAPLGRHDVEVVVGGTAALRWEEPWPVGVRVLESMRAFEAYLTARRSH